MGIILFRRDDSLGQASEMGIMTMYMFSLSLQILGNNFPLSSYVVIGDLESQCGATS